MMNITNWPIKLWARLRQLSGKQLFLVSSSFMVASITIFLILGYGKALITDTLLVNTGTWLGVLLGVIGIVLGIYALIPSPKDVVPTYTSHLFITYCAHASADKEWATLLVSYLKTNTHLSPLWLDDSNLDIKSAPIQTQLQNTAIFLVIWSDAYCDSMQCSKQFDHLLHLVKADRGRLFVVERESKESPKSLAGLNRYSFGKIDLANLQEPNFPKLTQLRDGMVSKLQDLRVITPPPAPPLLPSPPPSPPNLWVFVNASKEDVDLAEKIIHILRKHRLHGEALPRNTRQLSKDRKDRMQQCHGMIVIYGNTTDGWVQKQRTDFEKIRSQSNSHAAPLHIAVCEKPDNPPLLVSWGKHFNCGFEESMEPHVCDFLQEVKSHATI